MTSDPGCAAALVGVEAGDELVEVNGVVVTGPQDCYRAFRAPWTAACG